MKYILVVDDLAENRYLLTAALRSEGHEVLEAADGVRALELARGEPVDLVISDILMPQMDGFALCRAWQLDSALRAIPFVIYSATYTSEQDEQLALGLGATRFLRKPMETATLIAQLREILASPRSTGRDVPPPQLAEPDYYRMYNEALVRKLEKKVVELAEALAEKARGEQTLRMLSVAVEQSPSIIALTDTNGCFEYVNRRFCEVTGYSAEEVLGQSTRILKSGRMGPESYARLWATILSGQTWRGELQNRRKDGGLYWEDAAICPIRDEAGAVARFLKLSEDVSARRALNEQLIQSQKLEAMGRLAGGVAHDFNNVLAVILGLSELSVQQLRADDPLHGDLVLIKEAADRGAGIVRQLMAFARREESSPVPMDPALAIEALKAMLSRLVGEDIEIQTSLDPEAGLVEMDPTHFDQVVVNLVTNARDALSGGGRITISTAPEASIGDSVLGASEAARRSVRIAVSDTGCGMDEDTRARIFEPFFTTKPVGRGTGLGLATVLGIVKSAGGRIEVESERGAGSAISIILPVTDKVERAEEDHNGPPPRGQGETILLVEDDPGVLALARRVLEHFGYAPLSARSAREALLVASGTRSIALVLCDVVLPGGGLGFSESLRAHRPGLPVLFMSGYPADILAQRGSLPPGTAWLRKPFTPRALAEAVSGALATR